MIDTMLEKLGNVIDRLHAKYQITDNRFLAYGILLPLLVVTAIAGHILIGISRLTRMITRK
jgi:hypothetical protein